MPLHLTLPDEVVNAFPDMGTAPDRYALESIVFDLYREGRISAGKVAELLGLGRIEADRVLAERGLAHPLTLEDCERDLDALGEMLGR